MNSDPMRNLWKLPADRTSRNMFAPGRSPLEKKAKGGMDWGNPYDQFGGPHWDAMNRDDLLDRLLEVQHMLSPMRAPLSHEPEMRREFGPPVIEDYGRLRLPDVNMPLNYRLRDVAPWWREPEERPRPGGAPTEAYPWIG